MSRAPFTSRLIGGKSLSGSMPTTMSASSKDSSSREGPVSSGSSGGKVSSSSMASMMMMASSQRMNLLPASEEMDVVVAATSNSVDFLESWREIIEPHHVIIIQAGDGGKSFRIPDWLNGEVYNRASIKQILGPKAACISSKDSACRCMGWLLSRKKYVFTISEECVPAVFPDNGERIDPIQQHISNLRTPSTPFYFNTLYDPFRESTDFVRGYPFSLRQGVSTAISHGLWLNLADYDAPTQLVKPAERNFRYADCVMSIPKGTLYPMSGLNVAFNRELIGAAMYLPNLGEGQPPGLNDDMWAGWCSKVICDHLGLGVKTGLPYIWREGSLSPFASLKREYKSIFWQEEIIPFFQSIHLPDSVKTVDEAYLEIAAEVKVRLGKEDAYFNKLADSMTMWIEAWREMQSVEA